MHCSRRNLPYCFLLLTCLAKLSLITTGPDMQRQSRGPFWQYASVSSLTSSWCKRLESLWRNALRLCSNFKTFLKEALGEDGTAADIYNALRWAHSRLRGRFAWDAIHCISCRVQDPQADPNLNAWVCLAINEPVALAQLQSLSEEWKGERRGHFLGESAHLLAQPHCLLHSFVLPTAVSPLCHRDQITASLNVTHE